MERGRREGRREEGGREEGGRREGGRRGGGRKEQWTERGRNRVMEGKKQEEGLMVRSIEAIRKRGRRERREGKSNGEWAGGGRVEGVVTFIEPDTSGLPLPQTHTQTS